MRCPKCKEEISDNYCQNCKENIIDIYFHRIEEAQIEKNYRQALKEIDELETLVEDEKALKKIEDLRGNIQINLLNYNASNKKIKINYKKLSLSLFIILLLGFFSFKYSGQIFDRFSKKTSIMMVFNLNMPNSPVNDINGNVFYNKIFDLNSSFEDNRYYLNIGGTTIKGLKWYDNPLVNSIEQGVLNEKYILSGSTYSQNIIYSTPKWINDLAIKEHRNTLIDEFKINPDVFINPGNIWNSNIADKIIENGYRVSFFESKENKISTYKDLELINYSDTISKSFSEYLTGKLSLEDLIEKLDGQDFVCFNVDLDELLSKTKLEIEKFNKIRVRLEKFYIYIDKNRKLNITSYDNLSEDIKKEKIENIDFKVSRKLDNEAVKNGYNSWLDFNYGSEEMIKIRNYLKNNKDLEFDNKNIDELAKHTILNSLYNYGKVYPNKILKQNFDLRKNMFNYNIYNLELYKEIDKKIKFKNEMKYFKDINLDGQEEIIVINNDNFYVFSRFIGGRLLFWFDLNTGKEIIGSENSVQISESAETENSICALFYFDEKEYCVRVKALNEKIYIDNKEILLYEKNFNYSINKDEIIFDNYYLRKIVKFVENGLEINYEPKKNIEKITIINEVNPDYLTIIKNQADILEERINENRVSIKNILSNDEIVIEGELSNIRFNNSLHGKVMFGDLLDGGFKFSIKMK